MRLRYQEDLAGPVRGRVVEGIRMTPRERVMAAVAHREPDCLPVDLGAMRSTGITAIAHNRLRAHLGLDAELTRVYDLVQQLAEPPRALLDHFGIDALDAGWNFAASDREWREWQLPDGSACLVPSWFHPRREDHTWRVRDEDGDVIAEMPQGCLYFTQTIHPLAEAGRIPSADQIASLMGKVSWGGIPTPMFREGLGEKNLDRIRRHVKHLCETTDRAIMIGFGGNLFEWAAYLCRMDNVLMWLAMERKRLEALLDRLVEIHLANLEKLIEAVGEYVQIIQMGDDLGMESGPIFSPRIYREVFKPRHQAIFQHVKKRSNMAVFQHSCGSVYKLLPDLIEAGIDIVNPVQISAADMQPERLKRDFGDAVTFWGGGCDTQSVLPRSSPQEVADHVRRNVDVLAPGGGFVFCQVHNILADVPPVNVEAMYRAIGRT